LSSITDTVLLSREEECNAQIKEEPAEPIKLSLVRDDSPETLAGDIEEEMLFDISPVARLTPVSSVSSDILFQLMEAAESNSTQPTSLCAATATATDTGAIQATENFLEICSESDRTDFQESPSPTLRKSKKVTNRTTGAASRHFKRQAQSSAIQPPIRRLNFGNRLKKQAAKKAKKAKKSADAQSLEDLARMERAPSHNWDDDERGLLCVLNRWYCGRDRTAELDLFAKLFNSITGLDIPPKRVRVQFENHLRLYGAEAYPVFGRVFAVPFNDPEGEYAEIRALIEAEAVSLSLDLQQRRVESMARSGTAKFAKSPKTREFYKSLVRRASQEAVWQTSQVEDVMQSSHSIMEMSMAIRIPADEDWEVITDAEESPAAVVEQSSTLVVNSIEVPEFVPTRPHLTFRVWDAANRTKFIDGGFVAQTFVDWPRPFPAPIALDDPSEAGKILTVLHLSKQGDTPVYISTASVSSQGQLASAFANHL
jgi:hypothetical protein